MICIVCPPVREIIHSLKLVDYLLVQADKPWLKHYEWNDMEWDWTGRGNECRTQDVSDPAYSSDARSFGLWLGTFRTLFEYVSNPVFFVLVSFCPSQQKAHRKMISTVFSDINV